MPNQQKHLTKKQIKAKKFAEKVAGEEAKIVEAPKRLTEFLVLIKAGWILKQRRKSWKPTAEYLNDVNNCKIPEKMFPDKLINKTLLMNEGNVDFMSHAKNKAYYYELDIDNFEPCIVMGYGAPAGFDPKKELAAIAHGRWDINNPTINGSLGFFYNRTFNNPNSIDTPTQIKRCAAEMCDQRPQGLNVYTHDHEINGVKFYGVGIAHENMSPDYFAMSVFRHMVNGYTWYFHTKKAQQIMIDAFLEHETPPTLVEGKDFMDCFEDGE